MRRWIYRTMATGAAVVAWTTVSGANPASAYEPIPPYPSLIVQEHNADYWSPPPVDGYWDEWGVK